MKDLIQYRKSICEHEFAKCTYYDAHDYDESGDGYICTKCKFTKKKESDEYAKLTIPRLSLSNYSMQTYYKHQKQEYYLDDFVFDD